MYRTSGRQGTTEVLLPDTYSPQDVLRLQRLARELRLTDQILSYDLDAVSIVPAGPAPAWTTLEGDRISFSMAHMPLPISKVDIAVWLGTNAHELMHVLFSPRTDSTLMARVIEADQLFLKGVVPLHNICEDQRGERLLLARFSPWRNYLVAALGHHIKVREGGGAWLLVTGRTWLSSQIRDTARAMFVLARGESTAKEVTQLVGEYQRLTDPGEDEADEAMSILERLHTLFDLDIPPGGCGGGVLTSGEPETFPDDNGAPPTADEAEDEATGGKGKAGGEGDGPEGDIPAEGGGDEPTGTGAGAGDNPIPPKPLDQKQLKEELKNEARKGLERDPDAKADIESILDALRWGRPGVDIDGVMPEGRYREATDGARRLHREVADALLDFKEETEPGWVRRVNSGRIKVQRLLNPRVDPDTLFDRYEPGQMDASELELVCIIDVSGSMQKVTLNLAESLWAIWHAVDDLDGEATIFTFCSGPHRVLGRPGERPDQRMFHPQAWGGTDPESALREAFAHLANSPALNRLVIILTDGDWYGGQGDLVIAAMREFGITTVLAYLDTSQVVGMVTQPDPHGVEFFKEIAVPGDLALLFRDVALAKMKAQS
jgi:hypothetical protein